MVVVVPEQVQEPTFSEFTELKRERNLVSATFTFITQSLSKYLFLDL